MLKRSLITIIPIILLAGTCLLLFFINLAGARENSVLSWFFWSEVDSSGIPAANRDRVRWTPYSICGVQNGNNHDCTPTAPAFPYSPKDNFHSTEGIPESFIKDRDVYYYLSRIAYSFFLIGLFFSLIALGATILSSILAKFTIGIISSVTTGLALLFTISAACFITAAHVKGRNAFNDSGHSAHLGAKMFGITWAAVACLILTLIFMVLITASSARIYKKRTNEKNNLIDDRHSTSTSSYNQARHDTYNQRESAYVPEDTYDSGNVHATNQATGDISHHNDASKFHFFKIRRTHNDSVA